MNNDRELLELAARAAGIIGKWVTDYGSGDYYYQGNMRGIYVEHGLYGQNVWNPLLDDGDALRLAVRLRLQVPTIVDVFVVNDPTVKNLTIFAGREYEIVRHSIVKAAAEIGKTM